METEIEKKIRKIMLENGHNIYNSDEFNIYKVAKETFNYAIELAAEKARKREMRYPCDDNIEYADKKSILSLKLK